MRMVFPTNMTGRFLDDLAAEMNTFVESVLGDEVKSKAGTCGTKGACSFAPRMDVLETESSFRLSMDLPGVKLDDVHIDMEDDQVVVHGTREQAATAEGDEYRRVERSFGEFRRVMELPNMVDKDAITADFENGVLTIVMPKLVEEKTKRRIVINHGGSTDAGSHGE